MRTTPASVSGWVTRATASIAPSASNPMSRSWAPAAVRCRPVVERTTSVDFSALSSRATRRPTVAASTPNRCAAPPSDPARAAATKMRRSSQSNIGLTHAKMQIGSCNFALSSQARRC